MARFGRIGKIGKIEPFGYAGVLSIKSSVRGDESPANWMFTACWMARFGKIGRVGKIEPFGFAGVLSIKSMMLEHREANRKQVRFDAQPVRFRFAKRDLIVLGSTLNRFDYASRSTT